MRWVRAVNIAIASIRRRISGSSRSRIESLYRPICVIRNLSSSWSCFKKASKSTSLLESELIKTFHCFARTALAWTAEARPSSILHGAPNFLSRKQCPGKVYRPKFVTRAPGMNQSVRIAACIDGVVVFQSEEPLGTL